MTTTLAETPTLTTAQNAARAIDALETLALPPVIYCCFSRLDLLTVSVGHTLTEIPRVKEEAFELWRAAITGAMPERLDWDGGYTLISRGTYCDVPIELKAHICTPEETES